jgi:integrase/recombinase XerD
MSLTGEISEFLNDSKTRNLSKRTVKYYKDSLKQFEKFAEKNAIQQASEITTNHLRLYSAELLERMTPGGAHGLLRPLRALCGFLVREEVLEKNPFARFQLPRVGHKKLPHVTRDDYDSLMASARLSNKPLRDQALIALLFDCGLRASELTGLKFKDIRKEQGMLQIRGKGAKERLVPVSRHVLKRVQAYINSERQKSPLEEVFLTDPETAICYTSLRFIVARAFTRINAPEKSLHTFRRGFAVSFIKNGGDTFSLSKILGHSSLTMSLRYTTLDAQDLKEIHMRASPTRNS